MSKLKLRRINGDWDPIIPGLEEDLHFGPNHFTEVLLSRIPEPYLSVIRDEMEKGFLVDEDGKNPLEPKKGELKLKMRHSECLLANEENWPCQYSVDGSCPGDCIHVQLPAQPEGEELEEVIEEEEKPVALEEPEALDAGAFLAIPTHSLPDAVAVVHSASLLKEAMKRDKRKTARKIYKERIKAIQEVEAEEE